jgi:hypothetical protein
MQIDQPLLVGLAGVVGSVIAVLFREVMRAKDAHITELRETIKYQRSVIDHGLSTAGRAVDLAVEKGAP